jgi:two-component system, chemotaxis family, chemotaxis protein CheV
LVFDTGKGAVESMSFGKPLLEVGSNLFEVIEFTVTQHSLFAPALVNVAGQTQEKTGENSSVFAVNVAKVREVIRLPTITPCLTSRPEVLGVFNLRGVPIPAIHLPVALGIPQEPVPPGAQVIVTEFSRRVAGFVVHSARRIRRVSWDKVLPPSSDTFSAITGMMLAENGSFVFILDFERILMDIESQGMSSASVSHSDPMSVGHSVTSGGNWDPRFGQGAYHRSDFHPTLSFRPPTIIVVDDSSTARRALTDFLRTLDVEIMEFNNGEVAWQFLEKLDHPENIILISDVEMPRLDGYSLVMRIRKHPLLSKLPVIMHSSLTGEVNRERAQKSGADAYVSKFNRKEIMDALRSFLPVLSHTQKVAS